MNLFPISTLYSANNQEHTALAEHFLLYLQNSALAQDLILYTNSLSEKLQLEKQISLSPRANILTQQIKSQHRSLLLQKTVIKKQLLFEIKTNQPETLTSASQLLKSFTASGLDTPQISIPQIIKCISLFQSDTSSSAFAEHINKLSLSKKLSDFFFGKDELLRLLSLRETHRQTNPKNQIDSLRRSTDNAISLIDAKLQTLRFENNNPHIHTLIHQIQSIF